MVFILAASSLHHALETLTREEKEQFKNKIYSIPSLNPKTKNPKKVVQKLLSKELAEKKTTLLCGTMCRIIAFQNMRAIIVEH